MATKYSFSQDIALKIGGNSVLALTSTNIQALLGILGDGAGSGYSVHGQYSVSMSDQDMVLSAANSKNTQFRVSGTLSAQRKLTLSQAQLSGAYKWVENVTNKSLEVAFATGASVIIPSMSAAKVYSDGVDCQAMQIGAVTFDAVNAALATANATINVNSQKITGVANGSANSDAVNYAQLTAATFAGKPKTPAAAVATSPITGLTGLAKTIDGVAIDQANMTVLLVAQADAKDNGWWLSQSGAWTRPANFANGESADGSFGFVDQNGTSFGGSSWWCDTVGATVGTSNLTFLQFNGLADVNAGDGLTKTGNTLNVGANGDGSIVVNSDNIQVGVINATQHGTLVGGDLHELVSDSTAGFMAPAEHTKLAGVANNATYSPQGSSNPFAVSTSASAGTSTYVSREDHVHALPFSTVQSVLAAATGSISVNSQKITNLAAASSANDALAYGQSGASLAGLNSTGDIAMNSHKVSGLASASSSGDAIAYGQSGASLAGLNSTGAIAMNSHKVSGLADASLAGDALAYGQSSAMLAGLDVNSNKITSLASASASGDALAYGQSSAMLAGLNVNNEKITNLATPALSSDAATKGYVDGKAATAAPENVGTSASVGSSSKYALEDHVHDLSFSTAKSVLGEADSSIGLNGQKFTNLADANDAGQALIYGQSGASLGTGASIGSLTMSGQISMGSTNKIVNLATPSASSDAANKGYVDTYVDGKAATAAPLDVSTTAAVGTASKYAREDHVHDLPFSTVKSVLGEADSSIDLNAQKFINLGDATAAGQALIYNQDSAKLKNLDISGGKVSNLADANGSGQALVYGQNSASLGTGASIGSLTMSGQISMGSTNKIVNLAAPTASSDAATKGYVDGKAATAAPENVGTSASVGSSAKYALEDHVHDLPESTFRAVAAELTDKLAINGQNLESVGTLKFSNGLSVESLSGLTAGSAAHEYAELLRANSSAVTLPANSACTISVTAGGIDANGNSFKYAGLYEAVTDGSSNITWKSVDEQYSDINDTGFQFELDQTVTNAVSVYLETGASAVKAKIVGSMNITSIAKPV